MKRVMKRVPLSFDYPINQVWKGYINPYKPKACDICGGSGLNEETKRLQDTWADNNGRRGWMWNLTNDEIKALASANRLYEYTKVTKSGNNATGQELVTIIGDNILPVNNGYIPTQDEVNKVHMKAPHDTINRDICVEVRAKRLGVYGNCKHCNGEGQVFLSPHMRELYETWKREEPPRGVANQLWEYDPLGRPVSPVCMSLGEMAAWCSHNMTSEEGKKLSVDEWLHDLKLLALLFSGGSTSGSARQYTHMIQIDTRNND